MKFTSIWRIKQNGISAIRFEAARIPFLSDFFVAATVVVASAPYLLPLRPEYLFTLHQSVAQSLSNRVFSLTWPVSMQIYRNKRKRLHKKRVQLPQNWFGTPTWPPFLCFGTSIWPPWRHVKTLYIWRSSFKNGASLRYRKIAQKSPFLCVNRRISGMVLVPVQEPSGTYIQT